MGAQQFITAAEGKTADEAFRAAQDEAFYDYGHAGYTGTIAEKDDWTTLEIPLAADAGEEAILAYVRLAMYGDESQFDGKRAALASAVEDKWGPAGHVALGGDRHVFFGWASSLTLYSPTGIQAGHSPPSSGKGTQARTQDQRGESTMSMSVDVIYALHMKPGDLYAGQVVPDAPTRPVQTFAAAHVIREVSAFTDDAGVKWIRPNPVHGLATVNPVKATQQVLVIRRK